MITVKDISKRDKMWSIAVNEIVMYPLTRSNVPVCVLVCDPQVFCYSIKSGSTFRNILQMYFVAGTCTQKARAMCCRILVTLLVAAVPVASPLLILPLIIARFSGFKFGVGS